MSSLARQRGAVTFGRLDRTFEFLLHPSELVQLRISSRERQLICRWIPRMRISLLELALRVVLKQKDGLFEALGVLQSLLADQAGLFQFEVSKLFVIA